MRRLWVGVAGAAALLGLLCLALVVAPPWFVQHRPLEVAKAQNDVRTTLLQVFGGVALLVGVYFTYRQLSNSREQLAHTREQLQIAQQGQITERFTRAIDQLGHAQLDVRLGGIYALERIARDSIADRASIGEVLTAFVRSHAPWPPRLSGQYVATAPIDEVSELQARAADVQACLTVLGRGGFAPLEERQVDRLDLHAVDLRRANLSYIRLEEVDLRGAHLEGANLRNARLEGTILAAAHLEKADLFNAHLEAAYLRGAYLEGTFLSGTYLEGAALHEANLKGADLRGAYLVEAYVRDAHLEKADLWWSHLEGTDFRGAHLERANLDSAQLQGSSLYRAHLEDASLRFAFLEAADLRGAYLEGANLHGAHLEKADLRGAHLEGTLADGRTSWPAGFDWRTAGVIVTSEDAAATPPQEDERDGLGRKNQP